MCQHGTAGHDFMKKTRDGGEINVQAYELGSGCSDPCYKTLSTRSVHTFAEQVKFVRLKGVDGQIQIIIKVMKSVGSSFLRACHFALRFYFIYLCLLTCVIIFFKVFFKSNLLQIVFYLLYFNVF